MFKGVKAFLHVNLDEYIRIALLDGLLIAERKEWLVVTRDAPVFNCVCLHGCLVWAHIPYKCERKYFKCGDPVHLIGECPKLSRNYNQRAFVGGSWSDSDEGEEEKTKDENYVMAKASNE
nr:zf-CCHC domain-containing protein/DUF4219 domain-containing protein/UBN2 domain-containing protein [Tanacetum cinerariifolium]